MIPLFEFLSYAHDAKKLFSESEVVEIYSELADKDAVFASLKALEIISPSDPKQPVWMAIGHLQSGWGTYVKLIDRKRTVTRIFFSSSVDEDDRTWHDKCLRILWQMAELYRRVGNVMNLGTDLDRHFDKWRYLEKSLCHDRATKWIHNSSGRRESWFDQGQYNDLLAQLALTEAAYFRRMAEYGMSSGLTPLFQPVSVV